MNDVLDVCIIGGGWSGLTLAVKLVKKYPNIKLGIFEASPVLGGRARNVVFDEETTVDNGQHLFIDAYLHLWEILADLNIQREDYFKRIPLSLKLLNGSKVKEYGINKKFKHKILRSLSLIWSNLNGLSFLEKINASKLISAIIINNKKMDLKEFCEQKTWIKDSVFLKEFLYPLSIAITTSLPEDTDVRKLSEVFKICFLDKQDLSDLFIATKPLGDILPKHAETFLVEHNKLVLKNHRIRKISLEIDNTYSIHTRDKIFKTTKVVIATNPFHAKQLIPASFLNAKLEKLMNQYEPESISTIFIKSKNHITTNFDIVGSLDSYNQWLFKRHEKNMLSVVTSTNNDNKKITSNDIIDILKPFSEIIGEEFVIEKSRLIHEKFAAYACKPNLIYPEQPYISFKDNLFVIGDYLDKSYPATIESAVKSGIIASRVLTICG